MCSNATVQLELSNNELANAEFGLMRHVAIITVRTIAIYAFAAWVYVALVALFQPHTLTWQLTHLATWPRTDTFGEISFVVSLVCYWIYSLLSIRTQPPGS